MNFPTIIFTITATTLLSLSACSDNNGTSAPDGPDLSQIDGRDHNYFNQIYARCAVNNKVNDCNCVARVNVTHRADTYETYKAAYDTTHRPALELEIETLEATIEEKTKNSSDERIIESLEQNLDRLRERLENGIDDIDRFEMPLLPANATAACAIAT